MTLAISTAGTSNFALRVKDDFYLPGPPIRVGSSIMDPKYSRDGRYLVYIDECLERTYAEARARVITGDEASSPALMRLDIQSGSKQTLYTPNLGETLMSVTPVGAGGDVVCTIVVGVSSTDQLNWRAIYCPVGGQPRVVVDGVKTRSFVAIASPTERKAFLLICGREEAARVLYITGETTVEKSLGVVAEQGTFFSVTTRRGNPIVGLQGAPPDYSLVGNFELDYGTGQVTRTELPDAAEIPVPPLPLIQYDILKRSEGDPELGQFPLRDIQARPGAEKDGKGQLIVAQGVIALLGEGPNGLSFLYLSPDGCFLREMLKAKPALKERLKAKN